MAQNTDFLQENDTFWDFYWEMHLQPMENLGKREAILTTSRLIRFLHQQSKHPLKLLELGCGEGQILGSLLEAHSQLCDNKTSLGVDYNPQSLAQCRKNYSNLQWLEGDFTNPDLLVKLGSFDIILLVNAVHEVFSAKFSSELGEIDIPYAKQQVKQALTRTSSLLHPQGWLVLFDGLEPPGDPEKIIRLRFHNFHFRQEFEIFSKQYKPIKITYRQTKDPLCIELSQRNFTRYITKSIFLGKKLWQSERLESYQYFTETEYRTVFKQLGLKIIEQRTLTMNYDKWKRKVSIETKDFEFPYEHILILAQKSNG